jgi:hypothetical protein
MKRSVNVGGSSSRSSSTCVPRHSRGTEAARRRHSKKAVAVLTALVALGAASTAAAFSPRTAPKCTHVVPNGATVDMASGGVTLNGLFVAQYDDSTCIPPASSGGGKSASPQGTAVPDVSGQFPDSQVPAHGGSDNGGYYAGDYVDTTPNQVADELVSEMWVPGISPNNDSGEEYWAEWPGLFAWNWPDVSGQWPGGDALLQPVLLYANLGAGSHSYYYASIMDLDNGAVQYGTAWQRTSPGDWIIGGIVETASNSWEVYTADLNVSPTVYWKFYINNIPSSWSPFSTAMIIQPEGWSGNNVEQDWGALPSCQDLTGSDELALDLTTFDTPTPNWNSFRSFAGSWSTFTFGGSPRFPPNAPSCDWTAFVPEGSLPNQWFYAQFTP